jgi:hypothetical protein
MGMIRGAVDKTSLIKDTVARDPRSAGDRAPPVAGHECRDPEIAPGLQFDQSPDSSRSRGYGRYEI